MRQSAAFALDFVFPMTCASCSEWTGDEGLRVCRECSSKIKILAESVPICSKCGKPIALSDGLEYNSPHKNSSAVCLRCSVTGDILYDNVFVPEENSLREKGVRYNASAYCGVRAAAVYDGILSELIIKFKYQNAERLAAFFASLLFEAYGRYPEISSPDVVAPVPLHPFRRFTRGYNQSDLIARGFARMSGLNYRESLLRRAYSTPQQAKLSAAERRKNVAGAFAVGRRSLDSVKGKKILIIDDVMTTGSTLDACARALMDAGAAEVFCLVVATD
ncbi:MAG: ComF family protein [Endomicrobiia bacterium]|nr:ComF family protein [Endomicrobiia bacterium]